MELVLVSGVSGSGKTTFAKALEDFGFFVVDNLPVSLAQGLFELFEKSTGDMHKIAVVVDARDPNGLADFEDVWFRLKEQVPHAKLVFLEAKRSVLLKRFKESRRRHPLDLGDGLAKSLEKEEAILAHIRACADMTIQTDSFHVHQLKEIAHEKFAAHKDGHFRLTILSFGFKYGIPEEIDTCFDARFLPNPYFKPELKEKNGLNEAVSSYVLGLPATQEFIDYVTNFIKHFLPMYRSEGKSYFTLGIGCTGGFHRSVAIAQELQKKLETVGIIAHVEHRNISSNRAT